MSLSKTQFDILTQLEQNRESVTQRQMANATGRSLGTVNKTVLNLSRLGLIQDGMITDKGLEALEPYRVKRAVFIAAGFGTRLVPITLNTPKPLVRVNGTRIIDTLLDAIVAAGIEEIVIVRGYLGEQFDQLLYKYPNIRFIENPIYNEANNISSAVCAKDLLGGAYVLEADLMLYNPRLIQKYQYCSNYLGVPVKVTDDWCFQSRNGYITKLTIGGRDCHHMFGISYWTEQDGARLAGHLQQVFDMPGGKERYWDQAALEYFIHDYRVAIRECTFEDIIEIDTFRELVQLDSTYDIG
jgi:CTP:phosphocholine cytidylyltransferase-like protein